MSAKPGKGNKPKPSQTVVNRASKTRQRSQGKSKMFGGVGGYGGVDTGMVRQLINQTVKPELRAMRNDRKYINRQADRAVGDVNSLYNRSVGDLNHVYGEAGDYVNSLGSQISSGYDQTMRNTAATDAGAATQMQGNTDAAQQAIQSELQRLGLGGAAGVDPRLQQDAAFTQNMQAQTAANNQANLGAQQQGAATLTGLLGGMIQGGKVSNLGLASQSRQTGINDVNRAKQDDKSAINESMQELRASKPGMIREMLLQLQAQGFDQWQAIQSLNMSRRSMNHGMAMDRAGMAQDSAYYGTGAQAWGSQAASGSPGTGVLAGPASNPSWTSNAALGGKTPPKGGPKPPKKGGPKPPRHISGSQQDAIYGPLAGGI